MGDICLSAERAAQVAGRCSVFAKSDMIHLQQEATPDYDIVAVFNGWNIHEGADPFGPGTRNHPWAVGADAAERARDRVDAAFEFFSKMNVPFWCFHDFDMAWEGSSVRESEQNTRPSSSLIPIQ